MGKDFAEYISSICSSIRIDSRTRVAISKEIDAHLRDHAELLVRNGCADDEASRKAMESFGNPRDVARDLLMVHAQGTWRDAFLTSLPHLLVALLLTAYYAQSLVCMVAVLLAAGWGIRQAVARRAPPWSFSWMGYCLVPVVLIIFILLGATHWWTLLGMAYIPCAVLVVVYVLRQTVSRDSLYVSLMLSPWAIITAWFAAVHGLSDLQSVHLNSAAMLVHSRELVGSFVVLAIASFVFARLRPRWGKALALILPSAVVFGYVSLYCWGEVSLGGWAVSTLALVIVVLPAMREFLD
ncbi:MAG: hypothetical protein JXA58_04180 [Dehalococcoidia bacterium]|nr:hypothetical protein [Dehalococcoidia bacterium]